MIECIDGLVKQADECVYLDTLCEPAVLYRLIEIYKSKWSHKAKSPKSIATELFQIENAEPPVKFLAMWFVYYYVVKRIGSIIAVHGTARCAPSWPVPRRSPPVSPQQRRVVLRCDVLVHGEDLDGTV